MNDKYITVLIFGIINSIILIGLSIFIGSKIIYNLNISSSLKIIIFCVLCVFIIIVYLYIIIGLLNEKALFFERNNPNWKLKKEFSKFHTNGVNTWKEYIDKLPLLKSKWVDKIYINRYLQSIGVLGPDVIFMDYKKESINELFRVLKNRNTYCVKTSNLCEGLGVFIVVNGILVSEVIMPEYIKYKGPSKPGQKITVKEIVSALKQLYNINQTLNNRKHICKTPFITETGPYGVIVENVYQPHIILKIYVAAGEIRILYNYNPIILYNYNPKIILSAKIEFDNLIASTRMKKIRSICHTVANELGIPIIRLDFMIPKDPSLDIRINEITFEPTASFNWGFGPGRHMDDVVKFTDNILSELSKKQNKNQ